MRSARLGPAIALAALLLLSAPAWGHPRVVDPHNGCLIVGWNSLGSGIAALTAVGAPVSEWQAVLGLYPDNLCAPPHAGGAFAAGSSWSSHAGSCKGKANGTAVPGAYCGGPTSGLFTCVTQAIDPGLGIVVGVDANDDGRVDQLDAPAYPNQTTTVTEVMSAQPAPEAYEGPAFGYAFPPGRLIAYVAPQAPGPAPPTGSVLAACW